MTEIQIEGATSGSVDLSNATAVEELEKKVLELNKLLQSNPMLARLLDSTDPMALHLAPEMCLAQDRDGGNPVHVAAMNGHVDVLKELIEKAPEMCLARDRDDRNPVHVAAMNGHVDVLRVLVEKAPEMCLARDRDGRNPVHVAAMNGHVDVLKVLVKKAPEMCLERDRDGRNPVHVAAMKEHVNALKWLVEANPHAARDRLPWNDTILHLCVKMNRLESLKTLLEMIDDKEFVNAKDGEGNTILHLVVIGKKTEILKFVLEKKIDVNERNAQGHTAKDMLPSIKGSQKTSEDIEQIRKMKFYLDKAKAKRGIYVVQDEWISRNRDALMVVISLIATIAFQAGVSPAGGVWQDNSNGHSAGESVMAYHHPYWYNWYLVCSTLGFVASFTTLLLLNSGLPIRKVSCRWILMVVMMLTIAFVVASYGISVFWVTPKKHRHTLTEITMPAIILLIIGIVLLLLLHTCYFIVSLISAPKIPRSLTNTSERSSYTRQASALRQRLTQGTNICLEERKKKEEPPRIKKAKKPDNLESQWQEAMPSEPSNFDAESNVGMGIEDEEAGCALGVEMPKH